MSAWTLADLPDQTGRVFVVTGATSGIGLVTARKLAEHGAYVVLACRDVEKGRAVRATMAPNTEVRRVDLADLDSVRAFADELADWRIETLINNAGVFTDTLQRTAQGHELHFGTNVLGHFLLTQLLLRSGNLTDRVVWLSSTAHRMNALDLDDLDWRRRRFVSWRAYAASKLADLVLAYEQQRRFSGSGSPLRSVAAHPGFSATDLFAHASTPLLAQMVGLIGRVPLISQDAERGSASTLFAATVPDLAGGTYVGPSGPQEMQGPPRPVGSSARSHDRDLGRSLWAACEELTGLA